MKRQFLSNLFSAGPGLVKSGTNLSGCGAGVGIGLVSGFGPGCGIGFDSGFGPGCGTGFDSGFGPG
ncbi:hypothetical protein GIV26_11870 [Pseudomonas sp. PA-1-3F]|nr:hypothetical protein [Pseudomonas sp. PA-1-3F]